MTPALTWNRADELPPETAETKSLVQERACCFRLAAFHRQHVLFGGDQRTSSGESPPVPAKSGTGPLRSRSTLQVDNCRRFPLCCAASTRIKKAIDPMVIGHRGRHFLTVGRQRRAGACLMLARRDRTPHSRAIYHRIRSLS